MEQSWYYAINDQQSGPVEWTQLQQLAASRQLSPGDLVWREGMAEWVAAGTVPDLMAPAPPVLSSQIPGPPVPSFSAGQAPYVSGSGAVSLGPGYFAQPSAPYASFWLRLVAWVVDSIIVSIGWFCLAVVMLTIFQNKNRPDEVDPIMKVSLVVGFFLIWIYYALQESSFAQATLGKRMVGLKVTDLGGNRITFGAASVRYFAKVLSSILGVGFLMAALTQRKQGLHDLMANCLVVRRTP